MPVRLNPFRSDALTVGTVVEDAAARFEDAGLAYGHGTTTAFDDAAFLILESIDQPPDTLGKNWKRRLSEDEARRAAILVEMRIGTRKPSAYLVNRSYIQGIPFYVDERVIVPRSFVGEILTREGGFAPPGFPAAPETVLDMCTGSGCLALLAAHLFPEARIDAADLSADALAVARMNLEHHKLEDRVTLYQGDLFAPLGGRRYDLIVANPPYVDAQGMAALQPEHRHEPAMAFDGGGDGLALVRRLLEEAPAHLNKGGGLLCEVGRGRENLERAFPALSFLWLETEHSEGEVFWLPLKNIRQA